MSLSSAQARSDKAAGRLAAWASKGEYALWATLLFTGMFIFPEYPDVSLDPSWRIVLTHAFYHHLQFGDQIVFTHGPLGFLMGNTYDGAHFWPLIIWQVARGVGFTWIILHVARDLPGLARWIYFICFLLFGVYFEYTMHLAVVLFAGFREMKRVAAPRASCCIAFGLALALLSTIKFLTLLMALPTTVVVGIIFWKKTWRTPAIAIFGSYAAGFLFIWLWTRQELSHLPEYFLNSWRISQGYGEAMALAPPAGAAEKALGILFLCALFLVVHLSTSDRKTHAGWEVALICLYTFITWKHGFVRADGHMGGFFIGMLLPATCLPTLLIEGNRLPALKWTLAGAWGAISIWGLDQAQTISRSNAWDVYRDKITCTLGHVRHWKSFRESYDQETHRILIRSPLSATRRIVGDASIDMLGYEAGLLCLHGLNYQPRPVFQGYSAYSRELDLLNFRHLQSDNSPRFLLQKIQTVDGRLPSLDDASVLCALPDLYEFVLMEDGYALWRRRTGKTDTANPRLQPALLTGTQKPNLLLPLGRIADGPLWMEIDVPFTTRGVLRSLLFQPPIVELVINDTEGKTSRYRIPLSQARTGFILNPIIDDLAAYLHFVGNEQTRRIESVVVSIKSEDLKFVADEYRFSVRKIVRTVPSRSLAAEIHRSTFRFFKSVPDLDTAFAPPFESDIGGHPVLLMHAPSEMQFSLSARPTLISGQFGFLEKAYTEGGATDGAAFEITWTDKTGNDVLFSRFLDPLHIEADRGLHSFSIDLRKMHDGHLTLKTKPGPTGNNAWDWTAWSDIEIQQSE